MLDIAQDHLLCRLSEMGIFKRGLVFKGGTALRKCRAGTEGRFSTDLDFSCEDAELTLEVFELIHNFECHGFIFTLEDIDYEAGRAEMRVVPPISQGASDSPQFLRLSAKFEISPRRIWLKPELLPMLRSNIHNALGHDLPTLPVLNHNENVAEKLARYSRAPLIRDLYDLWWYGVNTEIDQDLVRSLWIKKVYYDKVIENRWKDRVFTPADILSDSKLSLMNPEEIGILVHQPDPAMWDQGFRNRYRFLLDLVESDIKWSRCDPRDEYTFNSTFKTMGD
jgi:predicted nucleotidyltransferase component of viral defense system